MVAAVAIAVANLAVRLLGQSLALLLCCTVKVARVAMSATTLPQDQVCWSALADLVRVVMGLRG